MKKSMHLIAIVVAVGAVALLYPHIKPLVAEYRQPAEKTKVVQTIKGKPKEGVVSAYVPDQPVEDDDGYHALVIDNSNNENPVYARLWTTGEDAHPIRAFTICEHGSFKMEICHPVLMNSVSRCFMRATMLSMAIRSMGLYWSQNK